VLVDCSDPRRPKVISSFEDGLTGGVHNVNYWNKRVFAISNTTGPAPTWFGETATRPPTRAIEIEIGAGGRSAFA